MNCEIISLNDAEIGEEPLRSLFDERLRHALSCQKTTIVFCLRPEMVCCTDILDWLAAWNLKIQQAKKKLIIVSASEAHYECLEVSHPDMGLRYVTSIDKVDSCYSEIPDSETVNAENLSLKADSNQTAREPVPEAMVQEIHAGQEPLAHLPIRVVEQNQPNRPVETIPIEAPLGPSVSAVVAPPVFNMAIGAPVTITGEYVCAACRVSRMWLRGDIAVVCDNPECKKPGIGWELSFELF